LSTVRCSPVSDSTKTMRENVSDQLNKGRIGE
jgi:hypothetical protein